MGTDMSANCSGANDDDTFKVQRRSLPEHGVDLSGAISLEGLNGGDVALLRLIVPAIAAFPGFDLSRAASHYVKNPRWERHEFSDIGNLNGHVLLTEDEDVPKDSFLQRLATTLVAVIFDVEHSYVPFERAEEGEEWIGQAYGDLWPSGGEFAYTWKFDTNEDHEYLAFLGLGSHLIRKVRDTDVHVPENTVYVLDLMDWYLFAVADGFARYGCVAYFDARKKILGIWVCYLNRYIDKNSEEWRHALYLYRATLLVHVTEADHVISAHLGVSTALVSASRFGLPVDHPLRHFLKPFIFRSAHVNNKIMYRLGAEKGLLSRVASFPDPELTSLMIYYSRCAKFPPFSDIPKINGMEDEPPEEYSFADAIPYSDIVRRFVRSYVDIYYHGNWDEIFADEHAMRMICIIRQKLLLVGVLDYDEFVENLTTCIVGVTGWHEQVGTVANYMKRADGLTAKIRPGQTIADHQAFAQASIVGVVTSISSPRLMNDWTYLLLEDEHLSETTKVFETFMKELEDFNGVVEDINSRRAVPIHSFHPKYLECAVSV